MNEKELNAIFGIIPDPEKNYINISDRKVLIEVERIVRVFQLVEAQNIEFKGDAVVNYSNLDLIPCEN
ncbi:MAG: hypothetical protein PHX18_00240 [Candidatus Gastranaerophilales bacterium]|nr:hypothetical protein [Candidatus Gastranaerophilales bacterium]